MSDTTDTLVGIKDGSGLVWWNADTQQPTTNIFLATKFTANEAALTTMRLKQIGISAFTDAIPVAGKRWMEANEKEG